MAVQDAPSERRVSEIYHKTVRDSALVCTCGRGNGDHAPECELERAWWDAVDQATDEFYDHIIEVTS